MESIRRVMLNTSSLEQWSEDMDSDITFFLMLLDESMKYIDINTGTVGVGHNSGTSTITAL